MALAFLDIAAWAAAQTAVATTATRPNLKTHTFKQENYILASFSLSELL
jgi:hypothetical protein